MKWIHYLISSLLLSGHAFSQSSQLPLNFASYAIKLSVSKDESFVLSTRAGEVGFCDSFTATWRRGEPKVEKDYLKPLIDQANFFNKDTGFLSGFIQNTDSKYNIVYHTTDGGLKWKPVNFGQEGWVDDAVNLDNGEAWLSVSGSGIAHTVDYGFTWEKFSFPETKQRYASIFFNVSHQGLIGSLWNYLAYTDNNCKTWNIIPTPLDQKAYNKTNISSRPQFSRVALYGNYLFVKQEDLVFYTPKDSIRWQWLKDYEDFYTDPANSAFYFKDKNGNYVRIDSKLYPVFSYTSSATAIDSKCKNGKLFIVTNNKVEKLTLDNHVISTTFITDKNVAVYPAIIGYTMNGSIGVSDNKAYIQRDYKGDWTYLFEFPIPVKTDELTIDESNQIIYNKTEDSLYYFDLRGNTVAKKSKMGMIRKFCEAGIYKIIFDAGSQGCFDFYSDRLTYTLDQDIFGSPVEESSGSEHDAVLPHNPGEIDGKVITDFSGIIPQLFQKSQLCSISDLNFTEQEYEQCRKDILKFKTALTSKKEKDFTSFYFHKNNLDFDKLVGLVDSVKHIDKQVLNRVWFDEDDVWSTTTFWKQVQLVNLNNEVLSIISRHYTSDAFCLPWTVSLYGYSINTTNFSINRFINKVYPLFLPEKDRVKVLHSLVKAIY